VNRQQRRKLAAQARKSGNKDLEDKLGLYSRLDEKCRVCEIPFDKTDHKMLSEWMIVVREKEDSINLYCPACWERANEIVSKLKEEKK
tara:strand:+ start:477 stop:740 length:264 start_codon:yes stop_codon:yes gene_type:complete